MERLDCYIINLKRSADRWKTIKHKLDTQKRLYPKRIEGVDGRELLSTENVFATKSMIGCMLSHIKTWKQIAKSDAPFGIVLEDDCQFNSDFGDKIDHLLTNLKDKNVDWDFLYLGYFGPGASCDSMTENIVSEFMKLYLDFVVLPKISHPQSDLIDYPYMPLGFHSYIISKTCAEKLCQLFEVESQLWHVDAMFLKYHSQFNVYVTKDKLGWQESTAGSSNMVEYDFPKVFNKMFDNVLDKDKISMSYYLTSPIGQIKGVHINLWLVFYILLLLAIPYEYYFILAFYILIEYMLSVRDKKSLTGFKHGVVFGLFFILKSIKMNK